MSDLQQKHSSSYVLALFFLLLRPDRLIKTFVVDR